MAEVDGQVEVPDDATGDAQPAAPANGGERILNWMGPEATERPAPSLRDAFAGIGGAVLAVGILIMVVGDDPSRGKFIGAGVAIALGAWALRMFVKVAALQALAVGAFVVGGAVFSVAVTEDRGDSTFVTGLVMVAVFGAAWALPGLRHRNLLLGIAALSLVAALGTLSGPDNDHYDRCSNYMDEGDYDRFNAECQDFYDESSDSLLPTDLTDQTGDEGLIYLGGALALFGATWWLDRRGRKGPATALVAAGLAAALIGTALKVADFGETTAPMFVTLVGVVVCIVGSHGARRATTWWGALLAAGGLIAFITAEMKPDSSTSNGAVAIVAALILIGTALVASAIQDNATRSQVATSPADGTEPDQ
ncbi:MAG: hypothetical protein Q7V57_03185 [Actinomycetota bacterium]|nr:hypothetical protein [Actinomycetota bacterium]